MDLTLLNASITLEDIKIDFKKLEQTQLPTEEGSKVLQNFPFDRL
jgi:hypothetical protein